MIISIASDHAGFELKEEIINYLKSLKLSPVDFGCHSKEKCDYPDFAHKLALGLKSQVCQKGILICGSGQGVAMSANKHQHIRAAVCWNTEIAKLSRQHNDSNVLCLPARFLNVEEAIEIVNAFLETEFEGGRHEIRRNKISE